MDSHAFYFLATVRASFGIIAVVLAASAIKYRTWLKHQPYQAADD
jgi:hypothetical protein